MEDKEVENIINKTLDERKKRNISKIFHDPAKAESAFLIAFSIGLVLGAAIIGLTFVADSPYDANKIILPKLDCESLKELVIDPNFSSYILTIHNLILSKCL